MARFGGNEFVGFSVPLVFEGRYFLVEPGDPPMVTVFREHNGEPVFEILRNEPVENDETDVSATHIGIAAVAKKGGGSFLYKVRPASETSVVFGTLKGEEMTARITDRKMVVGGLTLENNQFSGGDKGMAGVVVREDGSIAIGGGIPPIVLGWLSQD